MGKTVLVDTDILLKSYRGDKEKHRQLHLLKENFSVSVITAMELLNGARSIRQLASIKKELKACSIIHPTTETSNPTLQLYAKYSVQRQMKVADLLIGATALHFGFELYTDNKKHFRFIKGLRFYAEKQ